MCMITYIPGGVDIPIGGITNGSVINDDGHGWAVAAGSELLVGKSMKFDDALEGFLEARLSLGQASVAMFHSRFGTHGEEGEFNIHPFYMGEETVMAHNGVLPQKFWPGYEDRRSDTRIFVDRHSKEVDNPSGVPSRRAAARLGRKIGTGNKLVFLSVKSGQPRTRIVNVNQGIQVAGVWYSNSGYQTDYSWYGWSRRRPMDKYDWAETKADKEQSAGWADYMSDGKEIVPYPDEACQECGSKDLDLEIGMCNSCVSCLDCHDNFAYCLCWRPNGGLQPVENIQTIG